jgi:hypothetical protein
MTLTTPAPERDIRFSCPNPHCARFNRPGEGNIAHRSWTGTHQHIERLRCTACGREFSEREGTLMARSRSPMRASCLSRGSALSTSRICSMCPGARSKELYECEAPAGSMQVLGECLMTEIVPQ